MSNVDDIRLHGFYIINEYTIDFLVMIIIC